MTQLSGSCLCGAVTYDAAVEAPVAMNCACRDCQRATGSGYATFFVVPEAQLDLRGEVGSYTSTGESGRTVTRFFCSHCGSQLFSEVEARPGMRFVKAGSLNDPEAIKPSVNIWTRSRPSWAPLDDQPAVETQPNG